MVKYVKIGPPTEAEALAQIRRRSAAAVGPTDGEPGHRTPRTRTRNRWPSRTDPACLSLSGGRLAVCRIGRAIVGGVTRCVARTICGSCIIAVLWTGYFMLEGFDFGVGALLRIVGKDEKGRRVLINTIGPVWDGNEVWVVTAGGGHLRRVPRVVRVDVLRLLPGAAADPGVPDRPRGRLRVPRQGPQRSVAGPLGLVDPDHLMAAGAALGGGVRQHRARRSAGRRPRVRRQLPRSAEPVRAGDGADHARPCS